MVQRAYSGMSVNERLFVAGLLQDFEDAIQRGDRAAALTTLAAVGIEWPDAVLSSRLNVAESKHPERLFWPLLLLAAGLVGFWLYHLNSGSILPCPDGHCPDAGTPEYFAGVKQRNSNAPMAALVGSASVVLIGATIRTLVVWVRRRLG